MSGFVRAEARQERSSLTDLIDRLQKLFLREFNIDVPSAETDLLRAGLLDSLGLVDLLLHIEQEFRITTSFDALEVEDFRSLKSIAELLAGRQAPR